MRLLLMISLTAAAVASGCGGSTLSSPPVSITYRPSFVGMGKVVIITNTSNHHLYNVKMTINSSKSSASVLASEHLSPGACVHIGWWELEKWVVEPGETVTVYADDYGLGQYSTVPSD